MARRLGKEWNEITLWSLSSSIGQHVMTSRRTRHLWSPHVFLSAKRHRLDKVGAEARCLAGWDCSVAFYHAPFDEDSVVNPPKGLCPAGFVWQLRRAMNGTRKASLAFGSVVTEELVAMLAALFAEVLSRQCVFTAKRSMWPGSCTVMTSSPKDVRRLCSRKMNT